MLTFLVLYLLGMLIAYGYFVIGELYSYLVHKKLDTKFPITSYKTHEALLWVSSLWFPLLIAIVIDHIVGFFKGE